MSTPPVGDLYLDEPWVSIRWDKLHRCISTEWKAFANSVEFRAALMRALDAIKDKHAVAYLSDTRKIKVVVHTDQTWVTEVWVPLAVSLGLKRLAMVKAQTGLGKLNVEDVITRVDNDGLLMRGFDSVSDARTWLADLNRNVPA